MEFAGIELGPKMQACTERERLFVLHYLNMCFEFGKVDATAAARLAGYSDPGSGSSAIRVRAHELMHRERVREAMIEVGRTEFIGLLLPAIAARKKLIEDGKHRDHGGAVSSTLSALGLGERSTVDVNVSGSVTVNHTDAAVEDLARMLELGVSREKLVEAFGYSGLERYERMLADKRAREGKLIEGRADGGSVSDGPAD